jgi:ABC-2 type transport system permease protein
MYNMKIFNIFSHSNMILLSELVKTDFKLRYQGSALGYLWSVLKPLMMFAIMYVVFVHFLKFGSNIPHFAVALLLGQVLWGFFAESVGQGMRIIVERGDLLRKINFPKYIMVLSATIGAFINLTINLFIVLVFAIINGVAFHWYALFFPIVVIELYIFSIGLAFGLSSLFVKFRDIGQIWEVFLQGAYYATPIFWTISMVATQSQMAAQALMLNPMAQIIQDARFLLVDPANITTWQMNPWCLAILPVASTIIVAVWAGLHFSGRSKFFAEDI